MHKLRTPLIVTACVALAITLVVLLATDDQPRYKGRPLSNWLQQYSKYAVTQESPEFTQAQEAIRAISTNAIPFLLKWIRQQPPSWQRAAYKKLPDSITEAAPARFLIDGAGYERADGAMLAFRILGTNAEPAIPALVALMTGSTNRTIVARATAALSGLGGPAFPHLVAALSNTNQTRRSSIPFYFRLMARDLGTNVCLPPLRAALHDQDPAVREAASRVLRGLAPEILTNAPSQ